MYIYSYRYAVYMYRCCYNVTSTYHLSCLHNWRITTATNMFSPVKRLGPVRLGPVSPHPMMFSEAVEKIFSYCLSRGSFDISHADAEKALDGLHMDLIDLWIETGLHD